MCDKGNQKKAGETRLKDRGAYKLVYMEARGLCPDDVVACEYCDKEIAVDIHHIVPRSMGGTDEIDNLIGLGRDCHDRAVAADPEKRIDKQEFFDIVAKRKESKTWNKNGK